MLNASLSVNILLVNSKIIKSIIILDIDSRMSYKISMIKSLIIKKQFNYWKGDKDCTVIRFEIGEELLYTKRLRAFYKPNGDYIDIETAYHFTNHFQLING